VGAVSRLQQPHDTGHADRAAAHHRVVEAQRLARGIEEHGGRGAGRRRLASVERGERPARRVPVQEEGATADAGGLRLDQVEHELHRDRGVDRAAALAQHGNPGLDR